MLEVADETDVLVLTTLSVILLVISLIMGLKIRWFRTQMNMKATNSSSELESLYGVYRSQPTEVSSSAPLLSLSHNIIAGSSSYKSQISLSSEQLPTHPSLLHKSKTDLWKKPPASSIESPPEEPSRHNRKFEDGTKTKSASSKNPLSMPTEHNSVHTNSLQYPSVGQTQPSSHKKKSSDGNKIKSLFSLTKNPLSKQEKHNKPTHNSMQMSSSKIPPPFATVGQSQLSHNEEEDADGNRLEAPYAPIKNPLAKPDKQIKPVEVKKPPDYLGQSMKPKSRVPVSKGILQKVNPPQLPTTHDDSSTSLTLTDNNNTSLKQTDRSSASLKLKTPLPLHVLEQDESESES
ncbi:hypothetical protein B7P43_G10962 [Cryptotermes secundus]|uniref:Uncharacterized protein n=1 Tax=Cryptotermes secundus TaxID=105785 RepID=A0A2J7R5N5_9NEOP|nr:uncharacterized protein LOC111863240 [Cryptotermes secundus]PNF36130.1 hypothetical protein B7P43_G10962 [Cryptotermes secundus]